MTGHGGNIYRAAEETGLPESRIIDFSASINPLGISRKVEREIIRNIRYLINYPDPDATELRQHLSKHHHINEDSILCGNGSTELIYLIPKALKPKKVLVPQPTFSEYERAVFQNIVPPTHPSPARGEGEGGGGKLIKYLILNKENNFETDPDAFIKAMKSCDMAFLCNPNNPTGGLVKRREVLKIAEAAEKLKCHLVVDEAFIDFCPGDSVIKEVQAYSYLIVLRSMTKFYALSGLRLGYGVFPLRLIEMLNRHKEPWTVNTLAQEAGVAALDDRTYVTKTLALIKKEKRFLEGGFRKIGVRFFHSDANFYLLKINNADGICIALKRKGVLVRDCSNFKGLDSTYIRVAVRTRRENTILLKELLKFT